MSALDFSTKATSGVMELSSSLDEQKYFEAEVSVGYRLTEAFSLKGSVFGRFSDEKEYWGVQVSTPLTLILPGNFLSSYIAPGYRYMNDSYSAPTIEGGLNFHFMGSFGLGYRLIFNEWVKNGLKTESQFFGTVYF
ncbi:MAG: hypothetical protein ACRBBP_06710 [Bdellovibrionales bacterium]